MRLRPSPVCWNRHGPVQLFDALLGVLAQRLARTICPSCKEKYHPAEEEYQALAYGYGEAAFAQLGIRYKVLQGWTDYHQVKAVATR